MEKPGFALAQLLEEKDLRRKNSQLFVVVSEGMTIYNATCCKIYHRSRSQETFRWFARKFQELSSSSSEGTSSLLNSLAFVRLLSILREKIYQKEEEDKEDIFETKGRMKEELLGFLCLCMLYNRFSEMKLKCCFVRRLGGLKCPINFTCKFWKLEVPPTLAMLW